MGGPLYGSQRNHTKFVAKVAIFQFISEACGIKFLPHVMSLKDYVTICTSKKKLAGSC
jgi:hypothetical protein